MGQGWGINIHHNSHPQIPKNNTPSRLNINILIYLYIIYNYIYNIIIYIYIFPSNCSIILAVWAPANGSPMGQIQYSVHSIRIASWFASWLESLKIPTGGHPIKDTGWQVVLLWGTVHNLSHKPGWMKATQKNQAWLVGGFNPSEKYYSVGMIILNIWKNKKCSKPPTRWFINDSLIGIASHPTCDAEKYLNGLKLTFTG
jgi:hypothetical protein